MVCIVIDVVVIGDYVIVGLLLLSFVMINVIAAACFTVVVGRDDLVLCVIFL